MHIVDLILKKRNGRALTKAEIEFLINGYTKGSIEDYQMSAFLMAVYFQGMNHEESTNLALAMRDSGDIFDLSSIDGIKVDKHSTGGVGDTITLVLTPLLASLGAKVAKMSGRGLGHTGGTIDKLESIDGYQVELSFEDFLNQVNEIGLSVIGQSGDITPADKYIYALRDVTGTVPAIPLIASSIMSKKLASGANAICLDVKVGSGAFLETITEAKKLAELMVNIGNLAGRKMSAIITSMDEPLGNNIGNALEVKEAIEMLKGGGPEDLKIVVYEICKQLLIAAEIATEKNAEELLDERINNGQAFDKLVEMVEAQGGDKEVILNPELLPKAKNKIPFIAYKSGFIEEMDTEKIGVAAMLLGAGRKTMDDKIDMAVGLEFVNKVGSYVNKDDVICYLHANDKGVDQALEILQDSLKIGKNKKVLKLIEGVIK